MENNKSTLTFSQALKLYTGNSIQKFVLKSVPVTFLAYMATLVCFHILLGLENGIAAAHKEITESLISDMFMMMDCTIGIAIIMTLTFEKRLPGGKFFRTTKGGFDTYKKMRAALSIAIITLVVLYISAVYIVNAVGIFPLSNGFGSCVSTAIFLILAVGINNFAYMIKNDVARSLTNLFVFFVFGIIGILSAEVVDGSLGIFHLIMAIMTVGVVPISHKLMLENYRKNRWDN
ncbi:MAG: hypothetical protein IJ666_05820 [Ruminococcus sp.]|nr:hypothetical protein [Ruminococcus sp.]